MTNSTSTCAPYLLNMICHVISFCYHQTKMLQLCCYFVTQQIQHNHNEEDLIEVKRYYILLMTEGKTNTWYIPSCEGKNLDGTYEMNYLRRVQRRSDLKSKQTARFDNINSQAESIAECGVDGEWDVSQKRNMTFTLRNHVYISNLVKTMFTWKFELFLNYDTFWHFFAPCFIFWMMPYSLLTNECSWTVWVKLEAHMHQPYSRFWEFCNLIYFKCIISRIWAPVCSTFEIVSLLINDA